jgi:hypothetical protein
VSKRERKKDKDNENSRVENCVNYLFLKYGPGTGVIVQ